MPRANSKNKMENKHKIGQFSPKLKSVKEKTDFYLILNIKLMSSEIV